MPRQRPKPNVVQGTKRTKTKKRRQSPLYDKARREVTRANRGYFDDIDQALTEGRDLYEESRSQVQDIYGRLGNTIGDQVPAYNQAMEGIEQDFTGDISGLQNLLGGSGYTPEGESQAAMGVLGGIGGGTLGTLAGDQARNVGYMKSARRQAEVDGATLEKNYLEDYQDLVDQMRDMRLDADRDIDEQILERVDALKQQRFEKRTIKKQAKQEERLSDYVMGELDKQGDRIQNRRQNRRQEARQTEERQQNRRQRNRQTEENMSEGNRFADYQDPNKTSAIRSIHKSVEGEKFFDGKWWKPVAKAGSAKGGPKPTGNQVLRDGRIWEPMTHLNRRVRNRRRRRNS